ncbi:TonB-dependent copper receptor [Pseudoalteromonas piscicida]|uniref:TonB-dependent copper receptor n=1 Tax=Pseudoalteromonas TaxID=53246 RepID=UPI001572162D|nr:MULTISPECIES: TonB-dependent copper receptor [Pseudoalteromonas]NSY32191.1 TonB-dependent copper receptor [Pseudoalteromonas sp. JC28]UDM62154.1 TonB-dependent copper receptor [Pseudoalteromonas piscicida]
MKRTLLSLAIVSLSPITHADEIEKIVVIAPMQTPITLTTDTKAVRQPLPAQDGADLLSSIAGFSLIKKGGASADPVFRGMAGSRVAIIANNGQTLGGCGSRMDPPTAYITPQSYDTLKVIKGPQTVLYGPGNSAATVVFERENERLAKSEVIGFTNAVLSSQGRHSVNSDIKAGNERGYARIAANYSDADDYEDGNGTKVHSAYERWNIDTEFAYTPNDDAFYSITYGVSDGEVAYADRMMDGSLFDRENIGLNIKLSSLSSLIEELTFNAYYNYVDHIMDNHSLRPFVANMMMKTPTSSNPDRKTYGAKLTLTSEVNAQHTFVYGVDYQANEHRNRVSRDQFNNPVETMPRQIDAEFRQLGVFAEFEYQLGRSSQWVSGLRIDDWQSEDHRTMINAMMSMKPNPTALQTRDDTLFSGFSRYQAQSENSSYFAGFGVTERFPDYWEVVGGSRGSETSISAFNVDTEKTLQLDAGLVKQFKAINVNFSVFYNQIDDYLLVDNMFEKINMTSKVTRNIDAETFGFEGEVMWQASKALQLTGSINYVKGNNLTDNLALAQQPPLQLRIASNYQLSDKWQLGGLVRLVQHQHRVAIGQGNIAGQDIAATTGFGTLALNTNYQYSDALQLSAGVDNVLDKAYAEHLSRSGAAVSGFDQIDRVNEPGRTLWANLNWRF